MTITAKSPLKGLTERQLNVVQWLAKYPNAMLDISEGYRYSRRGVAKSVQLHLPADVRRDVAEVMRSELSSILGLRYNWRDIGPALGQVGSALLKKGLLVKVTVVQEAKGEGYTRQREVVRYTLANHVREAAGGIEQQLDKLAEREQAAIRREQAWNEAREPFATEAGQIRKRIYELRNALGAALAEHTAHRLMELHEEYHKAVAELNELNARYKVVADIHRRKYEPFTERGY
jgi:hypothetical protein